VTHSLSLPDADPKHMRHQRDKTSRDPAIPFTAWHRQAEHATERDEMGKKERKDTELTGLRA